MRKLQAVTTVGTLAAVLMVGCGTGPDKSREDAGDVTHRCTRAGQVGCYDKSKPRVVAFSNHFPNVETKCDGYGNRLYVLTHDSATGRNIEVVPGDPTCGGRR